MASRRDKIALLLCELLLLSLVVSSAFIVHEMAHGHDCSGEDCPVCRFIAQIVRLRDSFGGALLLLVAALFGAFMARAWHACGDGPAPATCTLVGRKIRLND